MEFGLKKKRHESRRGTICEEEGDQCEGEEGTREENVEVDMVKVQCICVFQCHNETHYFMQLIYTNHFFQKVLLKARFMTFLVYLSK
jgi:hypothetical protein